MTDQSFTVHTLSRMLWKSDIATDPQLANEPARTIFFQSAVDSALSNFSHGNPLTSFTLKGKTIYRTKLLSDELVLRKLCTNIKSVRKIKATNRNVVISNLLSHLSEGVPYRLYRLDIKSFYESFLIDDIVGYIQDIPGLSPHSKSLIKSLFEHYRTIGGIGLPRGLALSALLAEMLMEDFDSRVMAITGVYFYARYVDDMVILTNCDKGKRAIVEELKTFLPRALRLHETKRGILDVPGHSDLFSICFSCV